MLKLNEKYDIDRRFLKCVYIRHSPPETLTINAPNSQLYINLPRECSVTSLFNSYLDLNRELITKAYKYRSAKGNDIKLSNLGPIALFSNLKLTNSSGKDLEDISHAHIVSLMYILIKSSRCSDDLSIGLDRDCNKRRDELARKKNIKNKYHRRIMLRDVFDFADHEGKATYGLSYDLTLTRNEDYVFLNKAEDIVDARINIDFIDWYVPQYTPSNQQQGILSRETLIKTPTGSNILKDLLL